MRFREFKHALFNFWDGYFVSLQKGLQENTLRILSQENLLYPSLVIAIETDHFFAFELVGARTFPCKLKHTSRRLDCMDQYFDLFGRSDGSPSVVLEGKYVSFRGLCLSNDRAADLASKRFPIVEKFGVKILPIDASGPVVRVRKESDYCEFANCLIANEMNGAIKCKHVFYFAYLKKSHSVLELGSYLKSIVERRDDQGQLVSDVVLPVKGGSETLHQMAQFQSLFLSSGIREPIIGDFMDNHPQVIRKAFNTEEFVYEPYLRWIEHDGSVDDQAIKPDLMVMRDDGFFDIVDLKLAGLKHRKITKAQRRRRRFIDYVAEGLAQLANYEFYFNFNKNREFALEKYGVKVRDPHLILVVGHEESVLEDEVAEAMRAFGKKKFSIIDYDTLARSLVN